MATGEFTSVRSQNELVDAEVGVERKALRDNARGEAEELAQSLVQRGVDLELASQVAVQIGRNPEQALRFHAEQELGVKPDKLPSPYGAAGPSFCSFRTSSARIECG